MNLGDWGAEEGLDADAEVRGTITMDEGRGGGGGGTKLGGGCGGFWSAPSEQGGNE